MTWKDFDILTHRRSSRLLKTMMPHVIRNENPAYYDPEWIMIYIKIESLCTEQCADLDGVHTIEMHDKVQGSTFGAIVHIVTHWNVHVERRQIRAGLTGNSMTSWNCTTTQSECRQIRDGVREGGAM